MQHDNEQRQQGLRVVRKVEENDATQATHHLGMSVVEQKPTAEQKKIANQPRTQTSSTSTLPSWPATAVASGASLHVAEKSGVSVKVVSAAQADIKIESRVPAPPPVAECDATHGDNLDETFPPKKKLRTSTTAVKLEELQEPRQQANHGGDSAAPTPGKQRVCNPPACEDRVKLPSLSGEVSCDAAKAASCATPAATPASGTTPHSQNLEEKLREFVAQKLATHGDLDKASMVALEALSKMAPRAVIPAAAVSTPKPSRIHHAPPGLQNVPKFNGSNPAVLKQTLKVFSTCVHAALDRPEISPESINRALLRDVVFVLDGAALEWYNLLMKGRVAWDAAPPPDDSTAATATISSQTAGADRVRPPAKWKEVCNALEDQFLPAEGISRTCGALLSIRQAPGETIRNYAGRQMGLNHHLARLLERQEASLTVWEALQMGLFENGLTAPLLRAQRAEPACTSFEECIDRAEANDITLSARRAKVVEAAAADESVTHAHSLRSDILLPTAGSGARATAPVPDSYEALSWPDKSSAHIEPAADARRKSRHHYDDAVVLRGPSCKQYGSNDDGPRTVSEDADSQQYDSLHSNRRPTGKHWQDQERFRRIAAGRGGRKTRARGLRGGKGQNRQNDLKGNRGNETGKTLRCTITGCKCPSTHDSSQCFYHPKLGEKNRKQFMERRTKALTTESTKDVPVSRVATTLGNPETN